MLTWSCRAIVEHNASDLVAYSGQLNACAQTASVPFNVTLDVDADPTGMVQVIGATGRSLSTCAPSSSLRPS